MTQGRIDSKMSTEDSTTPSFLAEDFRNVSRIMRKELDTALARGGSHPGEVGAATEDVVRSFLSGYLPKRFSVGRGFLRDRDGRRSPQCDVVINDDSVAPPLPYGEGRSLYLAESVAAVVEVKKTLDRRELGKCVRQAQRMKSLRRAPVGDMVRLMSTSEKQLWDIVAFFVLSFESTWDVQKAGAVWAGLNESISVGATQHIDGIAMFDKGLLLWVDPEGDCYVGVRSRFRAIREVAIETGEDTLLFFLAHLCHRLPRVVFAPPPLTAYIPTGNYMTYGAHTVPLDE